MESTGKAQEVIHNRHGVLAEQATANAAEHERTVVEGQDWSSTQVDQLREALETLDERSRDILQQRWLGDEGKSTLHELADQYGVSAERIRQLEKAALKKLKVAMAECA